MKMGCCPRVRPDAVGNAAAHKPVGARVRVRVRVRVTRRSGQSCGSPNRCAGLRVDFGSCFKPATPPPPPHGHTTAATTTHTCNHHHHNTYTHTTAATTTHTHHHRHHHAFISPPPPPHIHTTTAVCVYVCRNGLCLLHCLRPGSTRAIPRCIYIHKKIFHQSFIQPINESINNSL